MSGPEQQTMAEAKCCIQQSAHRAHVGSHYLSIGDDQEAFGAFKRALSILQHVAQVYEDVIPVEATPASNDIDLPFVAIPYSCQDGTKIAFDTPEEEDNSYYFVYAQPFVFDPQVLDVSCIPIYLAIVIFDITVLLLRRARNERIKVSLEKALRLYDLALALLEGAPTHVDASNVTLATLNNKIHTCYCLYNFNEAHSALDEFSDRLCVVCSTKSVEEPELLDMILNSLLPRDPTRLAPAA